MLDPLAMLVVKTVSEPRMSARRLPVAIDAALERAVEQIVSSCGERSRELLTGQTPQLHRKGILHRSRTSPQRQRYELQQVQKGRRPFSTKTTVFDTPGYHEVV